MSPVTVFIFRVLLVLGGIVLMIIIGKPMTESIQYRFTGTSVQGVVEGFRGRGSSKGVYEENTSRRNAKRRSRRPVYKYPVAEGSLDSLTGYASSTILVPWLNFEKHEKVTVVFDPQKPEKSRLFSIGVLFSDLLLILLCLFMVRLGFIRR